MLAQCKYKKQKSPNGRLAYTVILFFSFFFFFLPFLSLEAYLEACQTSLIYHFFKVVNALLLKTAVTFTEEILNGELHFVCND